MCRLAVAGNERPSGGAADNGYGDAVPVCNEENNRSPVRRVAKSLEENGRIWRITLEILL